MKHIISSLIYLYLGFGAGLNYQLFKGGAKLYFREEAQPITQIKDTSLVLFIVSMIFVWPLYFSMKFRKKFMISGRWQ